MGKLLTKVRNLHKAVSCKGRNCPIHKPSNHHMVDWNMVLRFDRGMLIERVCPHGIGHPDPDSLEYLGGLASESGEEPDPGIHGCDGCCSKRSKKQKKVNPKWKIVRKPKVGR